MIAATRASSSVALASNNARNVHHATKKSALEKAAFTRHRISSRSVHRNRAIKEPSDVTEKISEGESVSDKEKEENKTDDVKRAPRPSTLNRPVSEAAVNSNAALANLKAAGGANGTFLLFVFCCSHRRSCLCIDGTRASINALSLLLLLLVCVSPYFFLVHKGKRKAHKRGQKKRGGKKIFFSLSGRSFYLVFLWKGRGEGKHKRESRPPPPPDDSLSLSLSLLLFVRNGRERKTFPLCARSIDRSIDRSREFARLFDCEGENSDKREREIFVISLLLFFEDFRKRTKTLWMVFISPFRGYTTQTTD